jgi:NAD+ diphosphatase
VSVPADTDPLSLSPLGRLALSRSAVDRATQRRTDVAWIEAAWADPRTRVVVVRNSQALVAPVGDQLELVFIRPDEAPEGTRFLLGTDVDGIAYFGVSGVAAGDGAADSEAWDRSARPDAKPMALRQVGALLSDRDAGLFTHAVALANWHDSHTHCPRCGTPTVPAPAGHLTTCPKDGTEHFPRLDPAVIMLVIDPQDRCLLARNALWPKGRMSVLAGFVEPGESAEHAVAREVYEETAIVVGQVRYLGSQPWPMPRSLMLGFQSMAAAGQAIAVDEEEIGEARWFSREEMRAAIDAGDFGLAPTSSIARRLIEYWYGAELPDGPAGWLAPPRLHPRPLALHFCPAIFLTKQTYLLDFLPEVRRRRGGGRQVHIATRMLGRGEADSSAGPGALSEPADGRPDGDVPQPSRPGAEGTLLAIVPIPGTATSLAIVGYPVTAPGAVAPVSPVQGAVLAAAASAVPAASAEVPGAAQERAGLLLDHHQRRVWVDGAEIPLTFQEFELLAFLSAHPATVFSRADLVSRVWQRDFTADSRTVDVHVSRLRRKLGKAYGKCLVTEYRVGYQFRPVTG